ncbi:substrate-binding domain-containing protein [Paenirhodobacter sp.]|uniref:substrate-binding domain-containing protein n=1 Tax=Paenirhodobacter sp. TaxID=1965326 RepID=UPI003B3ED9CF
MAMVFVAGSVAQAAARAAEAFGAPIAFRRGPAGLLAERIRAGDRCDLYISASEAGPRSLSGFAPHHVIAHNRMVLLARPGIAAGSDALALLADPRWRIGMSTPGADPSGDYAAGFLDGMPGAVRSRCRSLFGGQLPDPASTGSPALEVLRAGEADLLIIYATSARRIAQSLPGVSILPLPAPVTTICAALSQDADPVAREFLAFLTGAEGQRILMQSGFLGIGSAGG